MLTTYQVTEQLEQPEPLVDAEPSAPARRRPSRRSILLALLALLNVVVPAVIAWQASLTVPTYHLDGAFQTASGLFRLSEGDVPGRDFYPYLGIGPLYVLYPFFLLFGADLTASVFAAHFVALLSAQIVVAVLVSLIVRRRSVWVFGLAATVPLAVIAVTNLWPGVYGMESACGNCLGMIRYAADPGHSLRPLRAMAPYLLVLVAAAAFFGTWKQSTRMVTLGVATGVVAALWSNDYGLVSAALMVLLVTALQARRRDQAWMRSVLLLWGSSLAAFLGAGFLATWGRFVPYVEYNLVDVRGDQFWYFGPWDEPYRVFSAGDLRGVISIEGASIGLVALVVALVVAVRLRSLPWVLVAYLGVSTLAGGVTATVGGHAAYYFWAFRVWGLVVIATSLVMLVRYQAVLHRPALAHVWDRSTRLRRVVVALTVVALLGISGAAVSNAAEQRSSLASSDDFVWDADFGGYLDAEYADHVALARELGEPAVEEYFGLLGVADGPDPDLAVDAVIHALGDQRQAFADRLAERPEHVVTTTPERSENWANWNMTANWWFYRDLLRSYVPEQTSPMTIVWTRGDSVTWESVPCAVKGYHIELAAPVSGLYEVQLDYRGPGANSRSFSMVRTNLDIPLADGYLALDPGASRQSFPVYVHDPRVGVTNLAMKDVPAEEGEQLSKLIGCSASAVTYPDADATDDAIGGMLRANNVLPYWGTPVDATFGKWRDGVNTEHAAILVPRTEKNLRRFLAADSVRFATGETRTIEEITATSRWLNVTLSGDKLDRDETAYPNPFWLEKDAG
ncbi:hypothetical protein [Blastococcus sp. SYSU DS0617]